jgi:hypothetical protein
MACVLRLDLVVAGFYSLLACSLGQCGDVDSFILGFVVICVKVVFMVPLVLVQGMLP